MPPLKLFDWFEQNRSSIKKVLDNWAIDADKSVSISQKGDIDGRFNEYRVSFKPKGMFLYFAIGVWHQDHKKQVLYLEVSTSSANKMSMANEITEDVVREFVDHDYERTYKSTKYNSLFLKTININLEESIEQINDRALQRYADELADIIPGVKLLLNRKPNEKKERIKMNIEEGAASSNIGELFEEYRKKGQIEFITFHPSYAYEDFVEGIRPELGENRGGIKYKLKDGIFKQIAIRATYAIYKKLVEAGKIVDGPNYEIVWSELIQRIRDKSIKEIPLKGGKTLLINAITERDNLEVKHGELTSRIYIVGKQRMKAVYDYDGKSEITIVSKIREIIGGCNGSAYYAVLDELRKIKDELKQHVGEEEYREMLQQDYDLTEEADYEKMKNEVVDNMGEIDKAIKVKGMAEIEKYVLIIDEINRGDMSKIFGELITLIEEDKRLGAKNGIIVRLPYSGKEFAIPPNLYIIGTMNTADRSLALLDVALRRRFNFEEMRPELEEMLANPTAYGSQESELFNKSINALIIINKLLGGNPDIGKDKKIGHAYFCNVMSDDQIPGIWRNKIFPLLEEYYYYDKNDLEKLSRGVYTISEGWHEDSNIPKYLDDVISKQSTQE